MIPIWVEKRLDAKLHTRRIKKQRNCAIQPPTIVTSAAIVQIMWPLWRPKQHYTLHIIRYFIEKIDLVSLMLLANLFTKQD